MYIFFGENEMNELTLGNVLICAVCIIVIAILLLSKKTKSLWQKYSFLATQKNLLETQCTSAHATLTDLQVKITKANEQYEQAIARAEDASAATDRLIQSEEGRAKAELSRRESLIEQEFKEKEKYYQHEYESKKTEMFNNFYTLTEGYQELIEATQKELNEYQAKREAVNQAILREREIEEKADFYRIQIKENDIKDIEVLRTVEPQLANKEVLNKLIFEVFIKRPLNEMEKRVLQGQKIGGIYKITYLKTGESYIGRSVDIGNRWKEHCLSSLNIGTIAHSTFHNILAEKGLWNFTWEVLEEVPKEKQSAREKYWIDFYQTDKQFNQKAGG